MGAWGHDSFDNDDAMDWAGALVDAEEGMPEEEDDEEDGETTKEVLILGPISTIVQSPEDEYIDGDVGCEAVAAAEVIAAMFGKPSAALAAAAKDTSDDEGNTLGQIMGWLATTKSPLKSMGDLRRTAAEALERVLDAEVSELAEVWEESDHGEAWAKSVRDIQRRLN
jgi:hypothetical protein